MGKQQSPISKDVTGLENGYVISSKNYPIPPMATGTNPSFGATLASGGRETSIYTLEQFPTSIILYSAGNTPVNNEMSSDISNNPRRVFPNKDDANITELSVSDVSGYEIKLWLENEYNNGDMKESDFNVITLTKDNNNDPINFLKAGEPTAPLECNFKLAFNDMVNNNVDSGSSVIELELVDPSQTSILGQQYNSTINLTAILFEYANTVTSTVSESDWTPVKKMYFDGTNDTKTPITSVSELSDPNKNTLDANGIFTINRKNDSNTVNNKRYYYIKLNNEFLDVTNNDMHEYHSFRVRYRNASNNAFSINKESNQISIREPVKPTIASVEMTDSNKVTITLSPLNEDNVVYDVCSNILVNNQYSVYSRHLDLKAEYKLDNGSIITYKAMKDDVLGSKDYSYNGSQDANTTYVFDIPDGLGSGTDNITATQSYKWQFQFRVKNNVRNVWSAISDAAIDNNNITELSANAFEIVPVSTQNVLKNINFNNSQNERDDGKLYLSWDHPVSGNRGVVSGKLNDNTDPTIYDYVVSIFRNDVSTNQIVETFTNTQSNRITDAVKTKIHNNILTIIDKNGNSTNSSGSGNTNGNEKEIKVLVKQRNEYVTTQTDVSASMFYTLGKPGPPTQNTLINNIKKSGNNTITFKWNKNGNTGFSTRELINGNLDGNLSNKVISINRYRVIIEADRVNSKSPYYRLDRTTYGNTPMLSNIKISNSVSRDANLYLQASDGIIDKNDVYIDTIGNSLSNIDHVLVYPETKYTFSVYPRNRFFLESDNSLNVTITTSSPSPNILQLTNSTIPINSSYNNLNNNNAISYAQKGFLLDATINNLPTSITLYQITKAYNINLNNISASITHRINKNKFNDFLVDNDTDKNPNEYISEASQLDNKKLRQFRIYNVGESPSALLYVYGSNSSFDNITNNTSSTSMDNMISISTSNIKDEYSVTGKDTFNQGYWWQENMSYTISIDESKSKLYKNPVKLEFHTRYNNQLNSSSNFNNSSLETDTSVDDVSRIILQNSQNTNQVVYFDKLNSNPTASQNGTTDMIQISNFTNKINGVPNLYKISDSYGYEISLNYKLKNYSEYYGLNPSVNFVSHTFTPINKSGVAPRNWNAKLQCTRTTSGWTITDLPINETTNSLGSHSSSTTSNVQIQLNMENMYGTSNHTIGSNDSTIHKFIYDKTSVDLVNELMEASESSAPTVSNTTASPNGQLMRVPSDFNPHELASASRSSQNRSFDENVFNTFNTSYNNRQLLLYNGKFSTPKYLSQNEATFYNALHSNKDDYNITTTFKTDTDDSYSWVIYKFIRKHNQETGSFNLNWFVLSLNENTNITSNDLTQGNAQIWIQSKLTTDGTNYTTHEYNANSGDGGGKLTWIRYTPNFGAQTSSLAGTQDVGTNLGANNNASSFENSGDVGSSGINVTNTVYSTTKRNLVGLINNTNKISKSGNIIYYIAIGLKNNTNLWISKPYSFDAFLPNQTISR